MYICLNSAASVIQSAAPWQQQPQSCEDHVTKDTPTHVEIGPAVLDIYYWYQNDDGYSKLDREAQISHGYSPESHIR